MTMKRHTFQALALVLLGTAVRASDVTEVEINARCADRTAIEQVYHRHRLDEERPFDQVMPPGAVRALVLADVRKETVLEQVCHIPVSPGLVEDEVRRISATTRDPALLAELKAALGGDAARFARSVARPIVVERLLRSFFDANEAIHAPRRDQATLARDRWLATREKPLAERIECIKAEDPLRVESIEWRLQPPPMPPKDKREAGYPFADLPADLQRVLRLQLRQPGDVSAVIEADRHYQVFLCTTITDAVLVVRAVIVPKLSLEAWLDTVKHQKS
jgi:hypothetical protein